MQNLYEPDFCEAKNIFVRCGSFPFMPKEKKKNYRAFNTNQLVSGKYSRV